jgi:hypothetical protein
MTKYFKNLLAALMGRTEAAAAEPTVEPAAAPAAPTAAAEPTAAPETPTAAAEPTVEPAAPAAAEPTAEPAAVRTWALPRFKGEYAVLAYALYQKLAALGAVKFFTQRQTLVRFEGAAKLLIDVQRGDDAAIRVLTDAVEVVRPSSFAVAADLAARDSMFWGRQARDFIARKGGQNFSFRNAVRASSAWKNGYKPDDVVVGFVATILVALTWEGAPAPTQISNPAAAPAVEVPAPAAPAAVEVPSTPIPGAKAARKRARKIAASQR